MEDPHLLQLQSEYDNLKSVDQRRDELMQNLFNQLRDISALYRDEVNDHNAVKLANRSIQNRERELRDQLKGYQDIANRNSYILVLLDGDGMIFNQKYLSEGEAGGREAAGILSEYLRKYCQFSIQNMPPDFKIVVRVYVNLKGLADTCYKAGLIDSSATMTQFAYGFTGSKILYDVVDVGIGKERADSKIAETLKLNLNNSHCKHIVLGCSHDNGYARILEDESNPASLSRITLLEGVPFEKELYLLKSKYRAAKFDDLFRDTKISNHHSVGAPKQPTSPSPKQPLAKVAEGNNIANDPRKGPAPWATAAASVPSAPTNGEANAPKPPSPAPLDDKARIPVNRFGHRVDWPLRVKWDKYEVDKVKSQRLCAKQYILGQCYSKDCDLEHVKDVGPLALEYLKLFTRLRPCQNGLSCQSKNCIYGHACAQNEFGSRDCNWKRFGQKCWYPDELHGIDQQVVKTVIIGPK